MSFELDLQVACETTELPDEKLLMEWAQSALSVANTESEMTIRIVDESEIQALNRDYRGKDKPTNVLSFPADIPEELGINLLGDLIICAPVVNREAKEQGKTQTAHWAHMVIHGTLHLQGYDHIEPDEANVMETLEVEILSKHNFPDPYLLSPTS